MRLKFISFLLLLLSVSIASNAQESLAVTGLDDLAGKRVCSITGSVQEIYISAKHPEAVSVLLESEPDMFLLLAQGKADAIMSSGLTWKLQAANFKNLVCLCDTIEPIPIGVAFNKDKVLLKGKFNKFLKEYIEKGLVDSLEHIWIYDESHQMPDLNPDSCFNGKLVVATSSILPPYSYVKNGRLSGIELEMVSDFAKSEHMDVEFVDMSFQAIIPFLKSGKADMAAATICITEERSKSVDFSIAWTEEASAMITRRTDVSVAEHSDNQEQQVGFWEGIEQSFQNNVIEEQRYKLLLDGLFTTIIISLFAGLLGTLLGVLLCWGTMHKNVILRKSCDIYIEFMRRMPQVVFLMIMFYVVFAGIDISSMFVAIIAFALCFGAYTSVIFRSSLESIDKGQWEAALSIGFSKFRSFWYVILPQLVRRVLPVYQGEFIGLVKATSIVGYIAVFDLTKAGDVIRSRTYEAFFPLIIVTIIYFAIIWLLSLLLKYAEHKTELKRKKFYL